MPICIPLPFMSMSQIRVVERAEFSLLKWPAYLISFMLIAKPLVDAVMAVETFSPRAMQWRMNAIGYYSGLLLTPILGLLLAVVTAFLLRHLWALRGLSAASGLFAALLVPIMLVFMLDALQLRTQVTAEALTSYYFATARSLFTQGLSFVCLVALSISAWKASAARNTVAAREEVRRPADGLLRMSSTQLAQ